MRDQQDAVSIVQNAISEGNFIENGVEFSPLVLKTFSQENPFPRLLPPFVNIWNSQRGDTQISFYIFFWDNG